MKKKVLILGGGKSTEHEVSLVSAFNIFQNIPQKKYQPFLVAIDKNGKWRVGENLILNAANTGKTRINPKSKTIKIDEFINKNKIDVVFPILHGTWGEDGCIQGAFETMDLAYVGSSVKSSAVCMDKILTKMVLEKADIKIVDYRFFLSSQIPPSFKKLTEELNSKTLVAKAASLGSSVGIYICSNPKEFKAAWQKISLVDDKILIEKKITGREIEIAVLGNQNPKASLAGEILLDNHSFYSYEAKYLNSQGVTLIAPAKVKQLKIIQKIAIQAYKALQCSGLARVDFFVAKNQIYLNEINSLPGFTSISMYPKLWQISGISYPKLIEQLLELALEKKQLQKKQLLDFQKLIKLEKPN